MGGSRYPSRSDSLILKEWCTYFGAELEGLREGLAVWTLCLANESPPWSAYFALMAGCLVALDKPLGVYPVEIGNSVLRFIENLVQAITSHQSLATYGSNNLCAEMKSSIERAVHAIE